MIGKILFYELRQRFFHWTTLLFYLMMIFQGIWYTKGNFDYYINADLFINSPSVFYKNLAGIGMLMVIIVAIITGTSLYKDLQYKTGQWIYTLPVNEKQFYVGRFLSAFLFNVFIASGYLIGMILVPYSGIGQAHQFGPLPLGQLFHGFLYLTVPNLFLLTAIVFFALVFTKKMAIGYLSIFITVITFLIMQTTAESGGINDLLVWVDPFGFIATEEINLSFNSAERNAAYLPIASNLGVNRLIWFTIALLLFITSLSKFSFKSFGSSVKKVKKLKARPLKDSVNFVQKIRPQNLSFSTKDYLNKLLSLATLEFKNIVRPVSFRVILGVILLMAILQNLVWNATYYIGPTAPLTSTMTLFRLSFGVFIIILIMVWAGELFFKDSTVKIHYITDTLPVPVWVTQLSRFLAMAAVSFVLALSFMVIGLLIQIVKGGGSFIELDLYIYDILGYNWGWLTYVLWIALVFFIAGLTGNRFLTHIFSVGVFFVMIMAFELGLAEQTRFAYAAVPGLEDYSEVSGYGIWKTSAIWYFFMWSVLAVAFVLLGIHFWKRGTSRKWTEKLLFKGTQLSLVGKITIVIALIGFFTLQSFIVKNVNAIGNFTLAEEEEKEAADYEKKYGYLKNRTHPKYTNIDLEFDFFPLERRAQYNAKILLTNPSNKKTDTLLLNFKEHVQLNSLTSSGTALQLLFKDEIQNLSAYALSKSLQPNDSILIALKAEKKYVGFSQGGGEPQADLMYNGSFGHIKEFLPTIGYDYEKELDENRKRVDQELSKLNSRMASVNDTSALKENIYASDANGVTGIITMSTAINQTPLAPGKLKKGWIENNRNYRTYSIEKPTPFNWYLSSADFKSYTSIQNGTNIEILASPKHHFAISLYEDALQKSIEFIDNHLGIYPFKEVRLHEIPYYQDEFYAYPNSIAISEKEGWYADTTNVKERAYIFQSTATQIMKHWLQEHFSVANVQGGYMLADALPEAFGLQVLKESLGPEALEHMLQKKQDFYDKEKNNEANIELPLLYADGAVYIEAHKGAIALFKLMQTIGVVEFNKVLLTWSSDNSSPKIFMDLYQRLLDKVSPSKKEEIRKLFET